MSFEQFESLRDLTPKHERVIKVEFIIIFFIPRLSGCLVTFIFI